MEALSIQFVTALSCPIPLAYRACQLSIPVDFEPKPTSPAMTHPSSCDFKHASLDAFCGDLSRGLKGAFAKRTTRYDNVHAILIDWVEDDLGVKTEIAKLDTQLRSQFSFETEKFSIPSTSSERTLHDKIVDLERAYRDE